MAYVNKSYQSHYQVPAPVPQQPLYPAQPPLTRAPQVWQVPTSNLSGARRQAPIAHQVGYHRTHNAPYAFASAGRSSSMGTRSSSSRSHSAPQSPSLGGSKATITSKRSGNSTIQQEFHDKKVRRFLQAPQFGRGRSPVQFAVLLTIIGALFFIAGGVVLGLRFHNNVMLTIDKGEIIGPLLFVIGMCCLAGAIKFYHDAYTISNKERRKLQFTATSDNMVHISTVNVPHRRQPGEAIVSGTQSGNAVTRVPHSGPAPRQPTQTSRTSRTSRTSPHATTGTPVAASPAGTSVAAAAAPSARRQVTEV